MSTPDAWTAEFESSGQVIFPQRRNRLLIRLAIGLLLVGNSIWSIVDHIRTDDMSGIMGVLRLTSLAAFVYLVGLTLWQLVTRRPVVTINRDGITIGQSRRRGLLPWDKIARIDDPSGIPGIRTIPVQPVDRRGPGMAIPQDNVLELTALAEWLRTLHNRHRTPGT